MVTVSLYRAASEDTTGEMLQRWLKAIRGCKDVALAEVKTRNKWSSEFETRSGVKIKVARQNSYKVLEPCPPLPEKKAAKGYCAEVAMIITLVYFGVSEGMGDAGKNNRIATPKDFCPAFDKVLKLAALRQVETLKGPQSTAFKGSPSSHPSFSLMHKIPGLGDAQLQLQTATYRVGKGGKAAVNLLVNDLYRLLKHCLPGEWTEERNYYSITLDAGPLQPRIVLLGNTSLQMRGISPKTAAERKAYDEKYAKWKRDLKARFAARARAKASRKKALKAFEKSQIFRKKDEKKKVAASCPGGTCSYSCWRIASVAAPPFTRYASWESRSVQELTAQTHADSQL